MAVRFHRERERTVFWRRRDPVFLEKTIVTPAKEVEQQVVHSTPSSVSPTLGTVERVRALLKAMRPRQWTKNLAIFVGIVFAQRLFSLTLFERAFIAFIAFCLASSSIYLLNDLLDLENDRQHPTKGQRPLASGRLPTSWAIATI